MRGERSMRVATSLAALVTLLALSSPQLCFAETLSNDLSRHSSYGDPCYIDSDCKFNNSICHEWLKTCQCHPEVPISNYVDKCGKAASFNETCMFNEQCEEVDYKTECKNERCTCKFKMVPEVMVDGGVSCTHKKADTVLGTSSAILVITDEKKRKDAAPLKVKHQFSFV